MQQPRCVYGCDPRPPLSGAHVTLSPPPPTVVELPVASLPTGLRIGGELLPGRAEPIDVINPATGEVIAAVAAAEVEDIDHAVRVADETFRSGVWSRMAIHDRARIMHAFADGIEARMEDLYKLETMNNGRPITETKAQITRLSEWYRYNASLLLADRDAVVPRSEEHTSELQ